MALRKVLMIAQIFCNVLFQKRSLFYGHASDMSDLSWEYNWQENGIEVKQYLRIISPFECVERGIYLDGP